MSAIGFALSMAGKEFLEVSPLSFGSYIWHIESFLSVNCGD